MYPGAFEKICWPESEGGPTIRRTKDINAVKMAKLGWKLLIKTDNIWDQNFRNPKKEIPLP